jgi:hypothetical protein
MSRSAVSIRVFALYVLILGLTLVLAPNMLLALFNVPETSEVWIRVAGMLVLILGFYYFMASGKEMLAFYRWTVYGRLSVLVFFSAFVALKLAPPVLLLFGAADAAAALWTAYCLRKDAQPEAPRNMEASIGSHKNF